MLETSPTIRFTPAEQALVQALLYFEIFSHPLTVAELLRFSRFPASTTASQEEPEALRSLVEQGFVFRFDGFYQTSQDHSWIEHRLDCNRRADKYLPLAQRMARFIGAFPFIRAVLVSGSLSKHCMRADSDIDFFIVTAPGRLWLARTLLIVFKKLFLLNSHKYFCVNYFIDTEHLEIEEKNLFTATETVTLLPMYGQEWCAAFCQANTWAWTYFPNFPTPFRANTPPHQRGFLKKTAEWLLNGGFGAWLDIRLMRLTVGFWRRKFKHLDPRTFDAALKSRRYVSKHHPLYFQQRILAAYEQKVADWKNQ